MSEVVIDSSVISQTLSDVERIMKESREQLDRIIKENSQIRSYDELVKTKDLMRLYGNSADDYSKLCFMQTGVSEAVLDMKTVKKSIVSDNTAIPVSLVKTYKYRIESMIEQLTLFKEAVQSAKSGLEARVRYFNSCSYTSYDKVVGAKC